MSVWWISEFLQLLFRLAVQPPARLPVAWSTVTELAGSSYSPVTERGAKMRFVAWMLSGWGSQKLENCPLGLSRLYSRAGRKSKL